MEPRRELTYDEWLTQEEEANYVPVHKPQRFFGRPEGWEPEVTYGYSDFGHIKEEC